jgi:hypothetical protein
VMIHHQIRMYIMQHRYHIRTCHLSVLPGITFANHLLRKCSR